MKTVSAIVVLLSSLGCAASASKNENSSFEPSRSDAGQHPGERCIVAVSTNRQVSELWAYEWCTCRLPEIQGTICEPVWWRVLESKEDEASLSNCLLGLNLRSGAHCAPITG